MFLLLENKVKLTVFNNKGNLTKLRFYLLDASIKNFFRFLKNFLHAKDKMLLSNDQYLIQFYVPYLTWFQYKRRSPKRRSGQTREC